MQSKATSLEAYLAELPEKERSVIEALDEMIRSVFPDVVAVMKYGMPTYDLVGRSLAINAQKNYFSFYALPELVKKHRTELKGLDVGKSCIRFRQLDPALLDKLKNIVRAYRF